MRFIGLAAAVVLLVMAFIATGCVGVIRVPSATIEVTVPKTEVEVVPYDDTVLGWWITPHYFNRVWVEGFWTMDIIIIHQHWPWYHGYHRDHFRNYFDRHGFRGHHDDPRYHNPGHHPGKLSQPHQQQQRHQQQPKQKPKSKPKKK